MRHKEERVTRFSYGKTLKFTEYTEGKVNLCVILSWRRIFDPKGIHEYYSWVEQES